MTNEQISAVFVAAKRKAVDFNQSDYEDDAAFFDAVAIEDGYRLAGFRLRRAVFTTKPPQEDVS